MGSFIEQCFEKLGKASNEHPKLFIFIGLTLILVFSPFQGRISEVTDTNDLWVPAKSRAMEEHQLFQSTFTQTVQFEDDELSIVSPLMNDLLLVSKNALTVSTIVDHIKLYEDLISMKDLSSLCYRPRPIDSCLVNSFVPYFSGSDLSSLTDDDVVSTIRSALADEPSLAALLGKPQFSEDGIIEASAMSLKFYTIPVEETKVFEEKFVEELNSIQLNSEFYFLLGNSFNAEAGRAFGKDLWLLVVGISLSAVFIFILFIEKGKIRKLLPFVSLFVPFLAYSTGRGILGLFNFQTGQVNRFIPFLLLGISADDVFVIFNTRKRMIQRRVENLPQATLAKAGSAIFLTTITNVIAVSTAATSSLFSLRSFAYEGAVCISILFVLQILIIVPIVNKDKGSTKNVNEISTLNVTPPKAGYRAILLSFVLLILIFSVFGISQMEQEFELTDLTPPDSYIRDYFKQLSVHFPVSVGFLVLDDKAVAQWSQIESAASNVDITITNNNWVSSYPHSLEPINFDELSDWLQGGGLHFQNDVVIENDSFLSKVSIQFEALGSPTEQIQLVDKFRAAFDDFTGTIFVYSPSLPFIEQFRVLFSEAAQTLILSLTAIFMVTFLVIKSFKMALFCFVGVLIILTNVLGVLAIFSIPFSSIVVTGLCLSCGISIDYFIHICESFSAAKGGVEYRARKAVWLLKKAILSGAISTFAAVVPLAFSSTSVFRVFCVMFISTVILAFVYALFIAPQFLPVFFRPGTGENATVGSMTNVLPVDYFPDDSHSSSNTTQLGTEPFSLNSEFVDRQVDEASSDENADKEETKVDENEAQDEVTVLSAVRSTIKRTESLCENDEPDESTDGSVSSDTSSKSRVIS
ncbi:hypothetical protein P9112_008684 [Eukaryota sp. TZLM1-RC]